ncbi:MAG: FHA domain-containing protein, partial [Candidatus Eremiobacteraeota bacterium]|nr:FHA domain-containing protein [Candidatus Eremiobacteraeota bacterium]
MRDLDSRNGTFCNDKKVQPDQWTEVPPGSRVRFGGKPEAGFFLPDPAARPPELVAPTGLRVGVPEDGFTIGVGRDPANLLCLVGGGVSRNHAQLRWRGGLLWVQDLGSANGTRCDGRTVGSAWEPVFPGQRLQFGQTQVEVAARS